MWLKGGGLEFRRPGGPDRRHAPHHRGRKKPWISETLSWMRSDYCMLLPGPEAQQLATYIGWLMHRTLGGVMAGGLFILPGVVAIMGLSYGLRRLRQRPAWWRRCSSASRPQCSPSCWRQCSVLATACG